MFAPRRGRDTRGRWRRRRRRRTPGSGLTASSPPESSRGSIGAAFMRLRSLCFAIALCALLGGAWMGAQQSPTTFDILITGGRIVDGTGAPWYRGDVGITGDRITAIGQLAGATARTRIDATNLVVSPGFIDML